MRRRWLAETPLLAMLGLHGHWKISAIPVFDGTSTLCISQQNSYVAVLELSTGLRKRICNSLSCFSSTSDGACVSKH